LGKKINFSKFSPEEKKIMKKFSLMFVVLSVVLLLIVACAQQATPERVVETVVVEKEVVQTVEVEKEVTRIVEVEKEAEAEAPAAGTSDPNRRLNIFAVQHAECSWDSFWCTVQAGIEQAGIDDNVDVTILAPDEFDLDKTASLIEQAVAANPDGIMLTVTDPVLFKEPIMKAINAGIPVIAYNAGSGPIADGIPYLTYLGQDEYQGGYLGGLRLAADGGTRGVCINQQVGHAGLDKRCQGFVDALTEKGIEAEVLAITDDPAESATIIGDYYAANPTTDIFLTLGPNGANPFYVFLENEGLTGVKHGTFDLSPEIEANIKSGVTMFGIDQQPFLQGYGGIEILNLLIRHGIVPALPVTPTGPGFVTKDNLSTVEALAGEYR
jgi:simple sugar transport system substrate-binding protein